MPNTGCSHLEARHTEDMMAGHADRLDEDGKTDGTHEVGQVDALRLASLKQSKGLRHSPLCKMFYLCRLRLDHKSKKTEIFFFFRS
jgi:hypothetical protein